MKILENSSPATLERVDRIAGGIRGVDAADTLLVVILRIAFVRLRARSTKIFRASNRSLDQLPGRPSAVSGAQKGVIRGSRVQRVGRHGGSLATSQGLAD